MKHILKCGDCLDILSKIKDKSINLIVTDPPYDISATNGGETINNVKKMNASLKDLVDANINKGYNIEEVNTEFVRVMKEINIYIWCNKVQIPEYLDFYVNRHKCKFDIISWHKTNALPTYSNKYLTDTELIQNIVYIFAKVRANAFHNLMRTQRLTISPLSTTKTKNYIRTQQLNL